MNIGIPPRVIAEATRLGYAATAVAVAATCGLGVLGCLLAGLWIGVLPYVGPAGAPMVVAVALAMVAAAAFAMRPAIPPVAPPAAADDVARLLELATRMTQTDKVPMLLAALLAGAVAGARAK